MERSLTTLDHSITWRGGPIHIIHDRLFVIPSYSKITNSFLLAVMAFCSCRIPCRFSIYWLPPFLWPVQRKISIFRNQLDNIVSSFKTVHHLRSLPTPTSLPSIVLCKVILIYSSSGILGPASSYTAHKHAQDKLFCKLIYRLTQASIIYKCMHQILSQSIKLVQVLKDDISAILL